MKSVSMPLTIYVLAWIKPQNDSKRVLKTYRSFCSGSLAQARSPLQMNFSFTPLSSGVATIGARGAEFPLDSEKIVQNQEKEGKIRKKSRKRGKIRKKRPKSGRFFYFAPPDK